MKSNISVNRRIALGGILTALSVIAVFLASILPTGRISLYVLSSFFIAVMVIESGVKAGITVYVAASIMAFILVPSKTDIIPYVLFFGCYGVIKLFIEKLKNNGLEYFLKLVFFAIAAAVIYLTATAFIGDIDIKLPVAAIIAAAAVIFIIYDYVYTLVIAYYNDKISRFLKIR